MSKRATHCQLASMQLTIFSNNAIAHIFYMPHTLGIEHGNKKKENNQKQSVMLQTDCQVKCTLHA